MRGLNDNRNRATRPLHAGGHLTSRRRPPQRREPGDHWITRESDAAGKPESSQRGDHRSRTAVHWVLGQRSSAVARSERDRSLGDLGDSAVRQLQGQTAQRTSFTAMLSVTDLSQKGPHFQLKLRCPPFPEPKLSHLKPRSTPNHPQSPGIRQETALSPSAPSVAWPSGQRMVPAPPVLLPKRDQNEICLLGRLSGPL